MKEHPFPPVVRWALFPALAGVAGAVGGACFNARFAAMAGALSAGAALASMLTVRVWLSLVAAPAFGLIATASGMALFQALERGGAPDPRTMLARLSREPAALLILGGVALLHAAVHRFALPRSWPLGLAVGFGAAFSALAFTLLIIPEGAGPQVAFFLAASTLAQVAAVLAARAVARRLRSTSDSRP